MIREFHQDIFNAPAKTVICHQVNTMGYMGKGIALQVRDKYPDVYADYKKHCRSNSANLLMGSILVTPIDNNRLIAHLFGQVLYQTDYTMLGHALQKMNSLKYFLPDSWRIAIPQGMSCGNAKGDWLIVKRMIIKELGDDRLDFYIRETAPEAPVLAQMSLDDLVQAANPLNLEGL